MGIKSQVRKAFGLFRPFTDSQLEPKIQIPIDERMEERLNFLSYEVSELRSIVRHLAAESKSYQRYIKETQDSFDYQWKNLTEGAYMISDDTFQRESVRTLEKYTGLKEEWFNGKKVLDAGCGNGRWSWTLCKCGAQVTSIDISKSGVESVKTLCKEYPGFNAKQHNLLDDIGMPDTFDLVYSYGVVHHTGDTWRAVQNIAACVNPGGYLFMMIYGEPRKDMPQDFVEVNSYAALRRELSGMNFDERVEYLKEIKSEQYVHGWFDAVSPRINDLYRFDEIVEWLNYLGFTDIHLNMPEIRNLHIMSKRSI